MKELPPARRRHRRRRARRRRAGVGAGAAAAARRSGRRHRRRRDGAHRPRQGPRPDGGAAHARRPRAARARPPGAACSSSRSAPRIQAWPSPCWSATCDRHAGAMGGEVLLELSRRRSHAGDYDGAARELARAAQEGSDPGAVLQHAGDLEALMREAGAWLGIGRPGGHRRGQGAGALGASALRARAPPPPRSASWAACAGISARIRAAPRTRSSAPASSRPRAGCRAHARDLSAFGGVHEAIEALFGRADKATADTGHKLRANLLVEAANLATEHGMPERALLAAASAIESDPTRADAVAWVLGCFGRRAAHGRAARQLEKRGSIELALKHAAGLLRGVPSEGTSLRAPHPPGRRARRSDRGRARPWSGSPRRARRRCAPSGSSAPPPWPAPARRGCAPASICS